VVAIGRIRVSDLDITNEDPLTQSKEGKQSDKTDKAESRKRGKLEAKKA